jgi:hypothetical protein
MAHRRPSSRVTTCPSKRVSSNQATPERAFCVRVGGWWRVSDSDMALQKCAMVWTAPTRVARVPPTIYGSV